MLVEVYEDGFGVDHERLWRTLVAAHTNTGQSKSMVSSVNQYNHYSSIDPVCKSFFISLP